MSILTGMLPPTGGTASISGHDIKRELGKARQSLGLCPQHNMLFDQLTVWEHLILFGKVSKMDESHKKN
jgi:ATP-binding cassette subfamily A (ABC1) protein 3